MKTATKILLVVVSLLLLTDICWRIWVWHNFANYRTFANKFKLEILNTNDTSGVGIFYANTEVPLYTEFNYKNDGNSSMESYYFRGKDVFDITLNSNQPPKYGVYFRGLDKSVTWWIARSGTNFDDRVFYDTNGNFSKRQILYNDTWQTIDKRDGKGGIIIDGRWHQLKFFTNGIWAIETVANR
jgi:hypothetical protein